MGSENRFYSEAEFKLEPKWLVDPKLLFVGPKIGEGAHAKVYEGKYKNQNVAIKIVNKGDTSEEVAKREARFAREVAMLSKVQHKNMVKFIGACKEPVMVIVTELLLGGTLRKFLLNMRPRCLDMRVAIGFALDIARAIECLHSHGIIHRDLKPENLLLTADHKTVKLADFGLAREESLTEMMTAETGTYRWMAPELYSTVTLRHGEKKHYNNKVDAYSFAIVLWELIHNKLPFEGMSNLQAAYAAAFKVEKMLALFEVMYERHRNEDIHHNVGDSSCYTAPASIAWLPHLYFLPPHLTILKITLFMQLKDFIEFFKKPRV
ncbi:serine/threonine-protein kinase HT1-like isoform X2 [Olea europaea var. sylvestris]|nr:serine/threonine-protein kinase HT1-like isoform X2 [Olea europaea var. sylvestris]